MSNIQDAIKELEPKTIEIDWDNRSSLSTEQITDILGGKVNDVENELWELNCDYVWELENEIRKQVASDYDVEIEDLEDVFPSVSMSILPLARNTSGYIGLWLDIEHNPYYETYEDVECELEQLRVNPHDVNPDWPDIPRVNPLVSSEDLENLWLNMGYYGNYVALLNCGDTLEMIIKGETPKKLAAGASITIYDFLNGAGSDIVQTANDWKISPDDIYNDGNRQYGIQRCYGLTSSTWDGILEC